MKQELTPNQAAHLLLADGNASWSYNGALALCEYLDECGYEDFDVVAIRCDFNEYESAAEAAQDYSDFSCEREEEENEEDYQERREAEALKYLQDNTFVMVFNGGIIIEVF